MTTSLWNGWRNSKASRATRTHASGSSPFTWKIGACTILATSVEYSDERAASGGVVKPSWLLMTRWIGAADAVALDARQVERLGHDALAGERGVAVDAGAAAPSSASGSSMQVLLGPRHALDDRVDGLEVRRVGRQLDGDARCRGG